MKKSYHASFNELDYTQYITEHVYFFFKRIKHVLNEKYKRTKKK